MRIVGTDEVLVSLKHGIPDPTGGEARLTEITFREIIGEDEMEIAKQIYDTRGKKITEILRRCFCTGNGKEIEDKLITAELFRSMYLPDRRMAFAAVYAASFGKLPVYVDGCPEKKITTPILGELEFANLAFNPAHKHPKPKVKFDFELTKARKIRGIEVKKITLQIPLGIYQELKVEEMDKATLRLELCAHCIRVKELNADGKSPEAEKLTMEEVSRLSISDTSRISTEIFQQSWGFNTFQDVVCSKCGGKHTGIMDVEGFFVG